MRTHPNAVVRLALITVLSLGAAALVTGCGKGGDAPAGAAATTYSTKGTIKNFGPDKKFVSIAHETIPNYMAAMTMTFEPKTPTQLDGLSAGDKVEFSFDDVNGKRVISSIKKAP